MANVFLLGPSRWRVASNPSPTPMELRRGVEAVLRNAGHPTILLEDVLDLPDEDLVEKFDRVLVEMRITDIVAFWPASAKMQTTFDELLLLRDRASWPSLPSIHLLHEEKVAQIGPGTFQIIEPGDRSRYLTALARLNVASWPWTGREGLLDAAARLAENI